MKRITLSTPNGDQFWDIPLDHPSLSQGWYDVERDGLVQSRWTDGNARLVLPDAGDVLLLTLQADAGGITCKRLGGDRG